MEITSGIMPGQVLQRNKKNRAEARITGACEAAGVVEARVRKGARNLPGLNWRRTGRAKDGKFECRLSGIPAGGPYTLQLRISGGKVTSEALTVKPIFVGDVWFMGGQSNMQGIGNMEDAPRPRPMVRCFYMRDEWDAAKDPLHFLAEAVDAVHLTLSGISQPANPEQLRKERAAAQKGVGVGVFFGIEMFRRTRVPQGLVACGHGGTSMSQWSPQKKGEGGNSLYGAMLRRYRKLAQPAAGVLWYQGESDAGVEGYTKRMEELVSSVREDFGLPRLPWVVVQIGRVVGTGGDAKGWNSVQEQQRLLPDRIRNLEVVPTVDLELDDEIHISARGHAVLADRMARMADRLAPGKRKEAASIRVKDVRAVMKKSALGRPYNALEVTFSNVVGGLRSGGRPVGFSLSDAQGNPAGGFFKTTLSGNRAVLETSLQPIQLESMFVNYGLGCDPAVNVTDRRGMGLPVFGPVSGGLARGGPYILGWQSSKLEGQVTVEGLGYEQVTAAERAWKAASYPEMFPTRWMAMPEPLSQPRSGVYLLRTAVTCASALKAQLAMGSDGPFKVWLNGREVLSGPRATNPCLPDRYLARVELVEGSNEILVGFDSRGGMSWGICARLRPLRPSRALPEGVVKLPSE